MKKALVLALFAGVITLAVTGCKNSPKHNGDHPTSEHPTSEHQESEHPTSEHPQ